MGSCSSPRPWGLPHHPALCAQEWGHCAEGGWRPCPGLDGGWPLPSPRSRPAFSSLGPSVLPAPCALLLSTLPCPLGPLLCSPLPLLEDSAGFVFCIGKVSLRLCSLICFTKAVLLNGASPTLPQAPWLLPPWPLSSPALGIAISLSLCACVYSVYLPKATAPKSAAILSVLCRNHAFLLVSPLRSWQLPLAGSLTSV